VPSIAGVQLVHVATRIETGTRELAAPSGKQLLAAIRRLFDRWSDRRLREWRAIHRCRSRPNERS
jgi:hypothetical protein